MSKVVQLPEVLTVPETAARLKVSRPTVRKLIFVGRLKAYEVGVTSRRRVWRIDAASVAAYLEASTYQLPKPRAARRA